MSESQGKTADERVLVEATEDAETYAFRLDGRKAFEVERQWRSPHLCRTRGEAAACAHPLTWETWLAPGDVALVGRRQPDGTYRFAVQFVQPAEGALPLVVGAEPGARGTFQAGGFRQEMTRFALMTGEYLGLMESAAHAARPTGRDEATLDGFGRHLVFHRPCRDKGDD